MTETPNGPENMPFMTLAIGIINSAEHDFADIREITEMGAETRRKDIPGELVD